MSLYKERLHIIMKRGDQLLADLFKIIKKMKIIKDDAYPDKKIISKDDIENCPPLKREQERYYKKLRDLNRNTDALFNLSNDE